jgi:tetratricopeptide (TPR) repeat protein
VKGAGLALAVFAALSVTVAGAGTARGRDAVAEGRAHLRRANALAGNDRCEAAIKEYSLAYEKLHDPVVLFNRAECYRRIGEDASAAADYRAFLTAVPRAPNRVEIEAKIASLDLAPPPGGAASPVARAVSTVRLPRSPAVPPPPTVPPDSASPNLAPAAQVAASETPLISAPATRQAPIASPPSVQASGGPHGNLWMWATLGAAVAGGAVGAYLVLRAPGATPPSTELGNYRF